MLQLAAWLGFPTNSRIGPLIVVLQQPLGRQILFMSDVIKIVQIQPLLSRCPVETPDISILSWLSRLDIVYREELAIYPVYQVCAQMLRAIVATNRCRLSAPFIVFLQWCPCNPPRLGPLAMKNLLQCQELPGCSRQ